MSRVEPLKFITPQLASPVDQPPEGKHWIHEIKYDGYRTQLLLEPGQARVFTRNGFDWSDRYPSIIRAASHLPCHSAIIDGEAILPRGDGASDFEAFQSAIHDNPHSIILYAFDLMHLDGADLRQQPLSVRRSLLQRLIGNDENSRIQFSDQFVGDGAVLLRPVWITDLRASSPNKRSHPIARAAARLGSKPSASPIGTDRDRKTGALRALLAHPDSEGLNYAGAAFIALDDDARTEFLAEVARLTTSWTAFKSSRMTDVKWCQPKLTVRVKHLAGSKTLRHATLRELSVSCPTQRTSTANQIGSGARHQRHHKMSSLSGLNLSPAR